MRRHLLLLVALIVVATGLLVYALVGRSRIAVIPARDVTAAIRSELREEESEDDTTISGVETTKIRKAPRRSLTPRGVEIQIGYDSASKGRTSKGAVIAAADITLNPPDTATPAPTPTMPPVPTEESFLGALERASERPPVIYAPTVVQELRSGPPRTFYVTVPVEVPREDSQPAPGPGSSGPESPLEGTPRGYAALYLMQPNARAAVEREIETLIAANIKNVYLGVLTDGTFGQDFEYLGNVLRRLSAGGRSVTFAAYLTNGATMRKWDTTSINAGFNRIDPISFRDLIQFDDFIRSRFRELVNEVAPTFDLNTSLNPRNRNIAIVMLEDNLDDSSYVAMREIAREVLGDRARFVRNPCPGCYSGNTMSSAGDGLELHLAGDIPQLSSGDGFTLDGTGYNFPNESDPTRPTYEAVKQMLDTGTSRGFAYFGLWRFGRQGLAQGQIHPDRRQFEVQTDWQRAYEIELLRHGLGGTSPSSGVGRPQIGPTATVPFIN